MTTATEKVTPPLIRALREEGKAYKRATITVEHYYLDWYNAKQRRKAAEEVEENTGNVLRRFLGDAVVLVSEDGERMLATYNLAATSKFNMEAFKKDHPKLYKKYLKKGTERRLWAK